MRKLLFIAIAAFTLFSCGDKGGSVIGQKTSIEFQEEYKVGKFAKGEKIITEIDVKNTGDYPLIIAEVKGQCSCTVTDKPEDPILPGETGTIKSEIDTENFPPGAITKAISITANTEPSVSKVVIKADIIK